MFSFLEKILFTKTLKRTTFKLSKENLEWLKSHKNRLNRICECMKWYIATQTFNCITLREHQRRKDWCDCLEALQKLGDETEKKKKKRNWLTMKPEK